MTETRSTGIFHATREGYGFIRPDAGGEDLFVPAVETGGALHNDTVVFVVVVAPYRQRRPMINAEAAITDIVERGFRQFTGEVTGTARRMLLKPDHPLLPSRMRLLGPHAGVSLGQKLLCRLHESGGDNPPGAAFERILGDADDPLLDEETIIAEFGLPRLYPVEAARLALTRTQEPETDPPPSRRDFRGELTLTIDPADARDFDDAVTVIRQPDGLWRLRVHIADVAAGVLPDDALDSEAGKRGNSIYLPGKMIPMLPELLCAGQMSLSPKQDKKVLSVSVAIDGEGKVTRFRIDEGLIHSRYRLTYSQVARISAGREEAPGELIQILSDMNQLAQLLRRRRLKNGGIDLSVPEVRLTLGPDGRPATLTRQVSDPSHQLIEEFMILANRVTAHFAGSRNQPYIHRVHGSPDPLALERFSRDVQTLAPDVTGDDLKDIGTIRKWLGTRAPSPRNWLIHSLFLRAMQRAEYSHRPLGHFGLGLRWYGHFTSPIRRYADLFNHRVIKWMVRNPGKDAPAEWHDQAALIATSTTALERRAESAERALIRLKQLRWAEKRLGNSYRAMIVAVARRGYHVELDEVPVSGFVSRDDGFANKPYQRSGTRLGSGSGGMQVGLPVIVQLIMVDMRNRVLTLSIRAAGQRAESTDPTRLDPAPDTWERPPGRPARKGKKRNKSNKPANSRRQRDRKSRKSRRQR
jgi:ribonuclease R